MLRYTSRFRAAILLSEIFSTIHVVQHWFRSWALGSKCWVLMLAPSWALLHKALNHPFLKNYLFLVALGLCCCTWAFFSCVWELLMLQSMGSVVVTLSMWNLPGPGFKSVSPALAGRLLIMGPPGKFEPSILKFAFYHLQATQRMTMHLS